MTNPELNDVIAAQATYERLREEMEKAREALHAAIAEASRAKVKQRDIVAATGLTRERVRQIARDAGVGPMWS